MTFPRPSAGTVVIFLLAAVDHPLDFGEMGSFFKGIDAVQDIPWGHRVSLMCGPWSRLRWIVRSLELLCPGH